MSPKRQTLETPYPYYGDPVMVDTAARLERYCHGLRQAAQFLREEFPNV